MSRITCSIVLTMVALIGLSCNQKDDLSGKEKGCLQCLDEFISESERVIDYGQESDIENGLIHLQMQYKVRMNSTAFAAAKEYVAYYELYSRSSYRNTWDPSLKSMAVVRRHMEQVNNAKDRAEAACRSIWYHLWLKITKPARVETEGGEPLDYSFDAIVRMEYPAKLIALTEKHGNGRCVRAYYRSGAAGKHVPVILEFESGLRLKVQPGFPVEIDGVKVTIDRVEDYLVANPPLLLYRSE